MNISTLLVLSLYLLLQHHSNAQDAATIEWKVLQNKAFSEFSKLSAPPIIQYEKSLLEFESKAKNLQDYSLAESLRIQRSQIQLLYPDLISTIPVIASNDSSPRIIPNEQIQALNKTQLPLDIHELSPSLWFSLPEHLSHNQEIHSQSKQIPIQILAINNKPNIILEIRLKQQKISTQLWGINQNSFQFNSHLDPQTLHSVFIKQQYKFLQTWIQPLQLTATLIDSSPQQIILWFGSTTLQEALLESGLARVSESITSLNKESPNNHLIEMAKRFIQAEANAKHNSIGIWSFE
jgi:hypothetical protein